MRLPGRAGDDVGRQLGQRAVVERVGEVVAGRGGREVDPHRDVDDEVLPVAALVVEHAVVCRERSSRATRSGRATSLGHAVDDFEGVDRGPHVVHPHAPCPVRPASAEITAVAVSRPSGGRGLPSASASRAPRKRLRDAPTSTGMPVVDEFGQRAQQRPVVLGRLGETQAGVDDQLGRIHTGGHRGVDAASSSARTSATTSRVRRHVVRSGRVRPTPVHQHPRHPGVGDQRAAMFGSARPPETSLTIWAPALEGRRAPRRRAWCRC